MKKQTNKKKKWEIPLVVSMVMPLLIANHRKIYNFLLKKQIKNGITDTIDRVENVEKAILETNQNINQLVQDINNINATVLTILIVITILSIVWGLVYYFKFKKLQSGIQSIEKDLHKIIESLENKTDSNK